MKFVEVEKVPCPNRYHSLKSKWDEFMAMNIKIAKVDLDGHEYKNFKSASESMAVSVKKLGYPITVMRRGDEIYLIRRDM